jgi:hypothetical protein
MLAYHDKHIAVNVCWLIMITDAVNVCWLHSLLSVIMISQHTFTAICYHDKPACIHCYVFIMISQHTFTQIAVNVCWLIMITDSSECMLAYHDKHIAVIMISQHVFTAMCYHDKPAYIHCYVLS